MNLSYAYANARIKGMKSNLLGENVFRELMQVKTIDEITALLEQTPYKQDLVEASKNYSGVQMVDVALHNNLGKTIATVSRILPPDGRRLFSLLNADWDAQNLKRILSKKALGQEVSRGDLILTDAKKAKSYDRILEAKSFPEALSLISSKLGSRKLRGAIANSPSQADLRKVVKEIELERARQLLLLLRSASQSDPLTKKIVEQQLLFESVMVVLRLKKDGVKNAGEFVFYKSPLVNRLLEIEGFEECVKEAGIAFGLPQDAMAKSKESLSLLEIALERKVVERMLRWTRLGVLSFSTAVGFVFLKNVEVSNLRKIAYANAYNLKDELGEYIFAINA